MYEIPVHIIIPNYGFIVEKKRFPKKSVFYFILQSFPLLHINFDITCNRNLKIRPICTFKFNNHHTLIMKQLFVLEFRIINQAVLLF